MTRPYRPINLADVKTYSVTQRQHKSAVNRMGGLPPAGASVSQLLESLPRFFGAESFRRIVEAVVAAVRSDRPVVAAMGAHVVKVGCGPIIVDLIRRGVIKAIACNGATAIHDVELAIIGETSEEVADTIGDGSFGMVAETMEFFDHAVSMAAKGATGLGHAVGRLLCEREAPHREDSIFAATYTAGIPATMHVALGTDTIHMSHAMDAAAIGTASMYDFRLICDVVSDLGAADSAEVGGVWLNIGSAVILPEIFLKAVSVARNLGANLDAMVTANFDMIRHYRPRANVITRPVKDGHGHEIIGHHEIMLPLFRQAVVDGLARTE